MPRQQKLLCVMSRTTIFSGEICADLASVQIVLLLANKVVYLRVKENETEELCVSKLLQSILYRLCVGNDDINVATTTTIL